MADAPDSQAGHSRSWIWTNLTWPPFVALLVAGLSVRVALMFFYFPAVLLWADGPRFARLGGISFFGDFWMPAGYPAFLLGLRAITNELAFTIGVQHILGLGAGTCLFLAGRRLGLPKWAACLPATVALLSGDHLYLEHIVMADVLLTFLAAVGLSAAVFGLTGGPDWRWLVVASGFLASAALARSVGIVLLPIFVFGTAVWVRHGNGRITWLTALAAAGLPGLAVLLSYCALAWMAGGDYLGFSDMKGWNLYSRVAPFADCTKFQPPAGTEVLCEERKPAERPGPFGYVWDLEAVSRKSFALTPSEGKKLGAFAREAIVHQPVDYLKAVGTDLARYVRPSLGGARRYGGQAREIVSFAWHDPAVESEVVRAMSWGYRGTKVTARGREWLGLYQQTMRVGGWLLCTFFFFTLVGLAVAQEALRLGVFLFGSSAFCLYLVPVMTVSYDFRYGIPPALFLVVAGVLGAVGGWRRFRQRPKSVVS